MLEKLLTSFSFVFQTFFKSTDQVVSWTPTEKYQVRFPQVCSLSKVRPEQDDPYTWALITSQLTVILFGRKSLLKSMNS